MTTPLVEIPNRAFECAKMFGVKIVVDLLPLPLNPCGTVTSKIMQTAKLPKYDFAIELESCRIPFRTALPVVATQHSTVAAAFTHDASSAHGRTGAKSIRYFVHSKWGKVRYE